jgi:hypothetical protein
MNSRCLDKFNTKEDAITDYINSHNKYYTQTITEQDITTWTAAKGESCIRVNNTKGIDTLSLFTYNKKGQLVKQF